MSPEPRQSPPKEKSLAKERAKETLAPVAEMKEKMEKVEEDKESADPEMLVVAAED